MRAPNTAEVPQPPIPSPEITHQVIEPNTINTTTSPGRRGAVGIASVALVTTLAGLASSPGSEPHAERPNADKTTAVSYAANNMRSVGYESAINTPNSIYTGRVTLPRSTRSAKTLQTPSLTENDGVLIATQLGVSPERVAQGKKTEVTIAGRTVDLADYTQTTRVAEPWKTSKDCAWRWAEEDILVAGQKAKLSPEQIKKAVSDPKNVQRVMKNGYFKDNPSLSAAPHFLNTGVGYKAKHARAEADELVGSIKGANQAIKPKTDPDTKAQPQPDYKPKHAAPEAAPTKWERFKKVAVPVTQIGGLAIGGVLLVGGAFLGARRWRRRRQERYEEVSTTAKHSDNNRSPDPDGPGSPPPEEEDRLQKLRDITKEDESRGYDPLGLPSTGSHHTVGGGLGKSPYAPSGEAQPKMGSTSTPNNKFTLGGPVEPGTPPRTNIRDRFSYGGSAEHNTGRARLRSVPDTGTEVTEITQQRVYPNLQPVGIAEVPPVLKLVDAPTDPASGNVYPFPARRPRPAPGWIDPETGLLRKTYMPMHRRPSIDDDDDATDATQRIAMAV